MKLKKIIFLALATLTITAADAKNDPFDGPEIKANRVEKLADEPCDGIRVVGIGRSTNERSAKAMSLRDAQREVTNLLSAAVENVSREYSQSILVDDDAMDETILEDLTKFYSANIISLRKIGTPLKKMTKSKSGKKIMLYYQCYETALTAEEIAEDVVDTTEDILKKRSKTKEMVLKDRDKFIESLKDELKEGSDLLDEDESEEEIGVEE